MNDTIQVAVGSVAGRLHRKLARPNQDALAWARTRRGVVMVVCDGCGGALRSEVGAALGAQLWCRHLVTLLDTGAAVDDALFHAAGSAVVAHLGALAAAMAAEPATVIVDHFMFTSLAAVIAGDTVGVHAIGDGVVLLGDAVTTLGPFPDNQPPYLAQALLGARPAGRSWFAEMATIDRVAIASDGAGVLVESGLASGLTELAGDVGFRNPAALTRRLSRLAEDVVEIDWDARRVERRPALLDDDTTIACARWAVTP